MRSTSTARGPRGGNLSTHPVSTSLIAALSAGRAGRGEFNERNSIEFERADLAGGISVDTFPMETCSLDTLVSNPYCFLGEAMSSSQSMPNVPTTADRSLKG